MCTPTLLWMTYSRLAIAVSTYITSTLVWNQSLLTNHSRECPSRMYLEQMSNTCIKIWHHYASDVCIYCNVSSNILYTHKHTHTHTERERERERERQRDRETERQRERDSDRDRDRDRERQTENKSPVLSDSPLDQAVTTLRSSTMSSCKGSSHMCLLTVYIISVRGAEGHRTYSEHPDAHICCMKFCFRGKT
jgi:hypothetical protein